MFSTLLFLGGLGATEIIIISIAALVFFGANKIPDFARGLGKGIRDFRNAIKDVKDEVKEVDKDIEKL